MYQVRLEQALFPAETDQPILRRAIGEHLREIATRYPEKEALVEVTEAGGTGRRWLYRDLLAESERLALALFSRFEKDEKIVVWSPNSPAWVLMEYASALAGLVLVTANPALQQRELRYVLERSGAVALFHVREFRGNPMASIAAEAIKDNHAVRELVDMDDANALFATKGKPSGLPAVGPDDAAQIQYTSGTTGFPKGAVLSHAGLLNNARFYAGRCCVTHESCWLNIMPMFHTSGCGMVTLGSMQAGARMVLVGRFEPSIGLDLIEKEQVDIVLGVPTMILALLEEQERMPRDMSSLQLVSCGGAAVAADLVRRVQKAFGSDFSTLYGQTEYCPVITQHHAEDSIEDISETIGQPIPQTDVSIRRIEDNTVAALGEVGEICARGPCVMIGYHGDDKATAEAIDTEGWLHAGDLGVMDARGYLKITGRVKEMIIRGGENHFPVEIENAMLEHPGIAEVAVVGIPDKTWGELIACFFRPEAPALLGVDELRRHCRTQLSPQKTPNLWIEITNFPVTGSGKIQKFVLRDQFLQGDLTALASISQPPVKGESEKNLRTRHGR